MHNLHPNPYNRTKSLKSKVKIIEKGNDKEADSSNDALQSHASVNFNITKIKMEDLDNSLQFQFEEICVLAKETRDMIRSFRIDLSQAQIETENKI